ncbi:VWA domain-containing protein [Brumimicrobium glaciale]|uniref:VWA domain-containing protein n=1 Tax=Brumimicrobium glaciale TaxID=200475 RepID=A0A4Q4KIF4_9FLAO|nr:VWA domain-containing protein [Brumimicrobium glaciale]RYM32945.1 VWA domain-containing protein [Brumimicrobium glaciale]
MRTTVLLYLLFISIIGQTQVIFDKTSHDFEDINGNDERFVDIYIKNETNKEIYILSVKTPMEVASLQKNDRIQPDSSAVIRFHVNNRKKGRFDYSIPVYTSDNNEATTIRLKGKIVSLPTSNSLTACPTFGQKPAQGNPMDFMLTVQTIDKLTGENLGQSKVAILQNGSALGKWSTARNGELKIKLPLGITYFYATHEGYYPDELAQYVNFKNNFVTLALSKKEEIEETPELIINEESELIVEEMPQEEKGEQILAEVVEEPKEERVIIIEENQPEIDLSDIIEETPVFKEVVKEEIPEFEKLDKENFDLKYFKPINVVFVLDVSSSMNRYDRAELLKYSLDQLLGMLRPEDKIGLVSYSSDAQVLLDPTAGDQKEMISEVVQKLKISGQTAGGKGIKLGYKQVKKNSKAGIQNHLIIITDGAFNQSSGDYKKYIEKNLSKNNTTMSVVGIKTNSKAEESMREAAELGNGRFILIEKLADAQNKLKEEIRLSTFKFN